MTVIYLTYWGLEEGLTKATVLPHVALLEKSSKVSNVILCTIERGPRMESRQLSRKVFHAPWNSSHSFADKILDFVRLPRMLTDLVRSRNVRFIFSRGTPAGALAYLVYSQTGTEYSVESFEPHAEYMRESGVWPRCGLRYLLQRYWERRQRETARFLLPVAHQFYQHLLAQKVSRSRILVMPCAVDLERFQFSATERRRIRTSMNLADDVVVGIYVGKFGGMYYEAEAFRIFARIREYFPHFHLVILSPHPSDTIQGQLTAIGFREEDFHVRNVDQAEVPAFLSAADFGLALYKPGYYKRYLSPIKIGEYWACGLPVLITENIGDDSGIIHDRKAGGVYSLEKGTLEQGLRQLEATLQYGREVNSERIRSLAVEYRNPERDMTVYHFLLDTVL